MTITYKCDVCKQSKEKNDLLRLVAFKKRKMATKVHDKSVSSKDICLECYNKTFNKGGK